MKITIPIKRYYLFIIVLDLAVVFFGLTIFSDMIHGEILSDIIISILIWILLLLYAVWFSFGREVIVFHDDRIEYKKTLGLLDFKSTYFYSYISEIKTINSLHKSQLFVSETLQSMKELNRSFPFWYRMGKISFKYKNKNKNFFNGASKSQIEYIIQELKERSGNVSSSGASMQQRHL